MPEVPQAQSGRVERTTIAAPQQNIGIASPDAYGASIAEGAERGFVKADNARMRYREVVVSTAATDHLNNLHVIQAKRRAEYAQAKGKNAIGLTQRAEEEFNKDVEDISKEIKDPEIKARFSQASRTVWNGTHNEATRHEASQAAIFRRETHGSARQLSINQGINSGTPNALEDAEKQAAFHVGEITTQSGDDEGTKELELQKNRDLIYGGHIESVMKNMTPSAANAELERYKDKLSKPVYDTLIGRNKQGSINQEASDKADEIILSPESTIETAMTEINKIKDAEVRDRTQRYVFERLKIRESIKLDKQAQTYGDMAKEVLSGEKTVGELKEDPRYDSLDISAQANLDKIEKDRLRGLEPSKNSDEYIKLMRDTWENPTVFMDTRLENYRGTIDEIQLASLINVQTEMKSAQKSGGKLSARTQGVLTNAQKTDMYANKIGLSTSQKDGMYSKPYMEYMSAADAEMRKLVDPTPEETTRLLDELTKEYVINGKKFKRYEGIKDATEEFRELERTADGKRTIKTIEDQWREERGRLPTAEELIGVYYGGADERKETAPKGSNNEIKSYYPSGPYIPYQK